MTIGENIKRLRKQNKITQQQLADKLKISFQAVSKWENDKSMPDISLLSEVANALNTDIDALMGYVPNQKQISHFQKRYENQEYYWGVSPDKLCFKVLELKMGSPCTLIDIGCGEGRNSVFFAQNGFNVTSVDISKNGIEKAKNFADLQGVKINAFTANIFDFRLENKFDVIFCIGTLNYIPENLRKEIIDNYIQSLNPNGIVVFNAKITKPFLPDFTDQFSYKWVAGELESYFKDLEFIHTQEIYLNDQCTSLIIAKRRI